MGCLEKSLIIWILMLGLPGSHCISINSLIWREPAFAVLYLDNVDDVFAVFSPDMWIDFSSSANNEQQNTTHHTCDVGL